jgi:hypothetical protein
MERDYKKNFSPLKTFNMKQRLNWRLKSINMLNFKKKPWAPFLSKNY